MESFTPPLLLVAWLVAGAHFTGAQPFDCSLFGEQVPAVGQDLDSAPFPLIFLVAAGFWPQLPVEYVLVLFGLLAVIFRFLFCPGQRRVR